MWYGIDCFRGLTLAGKHKESATAVIVSVLFSFILYVISRSKQGITGS